MPETQTTVGGLRAIELLFRPLREIATGRSICFLSRTQLNTPELGTLMPEAFRSAAEFSGQSRKLFPLEHLQLAESIRALQEAERPFDWLSLEMPMRILKDAATAALLDKVCEQFQLSPNKFCFAIPEQILLGENPEAYANVTNLRRRGYHMMICGFGETGCPILRLAELSVDWVLLSPRITRFLGKGERTDQAVHSIVTFINDLGCEPIADGVKNSSQAESLYEFGCNFCAGPLSGDYLRVSEMI